MFLKIVTCIMIVVACVWVGSRFMETPVVCLKHELMLQAACRFLMHHVVRLRLKLGLVC